MITLQLTTCAPVAARISGSNFYLFYKGSDSMWQFPVGGNDDILGGVASYIRNIPSYMPDLSGRTPDAVTVVGSNINMVFLGKCSSMTR